MFFSDFGLDPRLLSGVRALGFGEPTPIQAGTIPSALTGQDVMGSAETGTGKTAAYVLPLFHRLLAARSNSHRLRALVLVPTRELALQVAEQAEQLAGDADLSVAAIYGGVAMGPQVSALRRGVDLVIATPGRLLDHAERRTLSFDAVEILVIDEADRMLDVGFLPDLRRIVRLLPRERQTMLFSATLGPEIVSLAREVTRNAVRIQKETAAAPDAIEQTLFPVPEHLKNEVLHKLLREEDMDSVLVFARTKHRADKVARQLTRANIQATVIHGDRTQSQREAALDSFRQGQTRVLVATDIAARGIDVEGISHVINYDVPMQPEDYVHRIGRTGRAQASGNAYTLVAPVDEGMVQRIENLIKHKIQRRRLDGVNYAAPAFVQPDTEAIRRYVEANRRAQPTAPRTSAGSLTTARRTR